MPRTVAAGELGRLDPRRIVVLGDGLAAGMGEFGLHARSQPWSFPAQVARQMGVQLSLPLFEPPGLSCPLVSDRSDVSPPNLFETTVLKDYPPGALPANLSVPGITFREAVDLRTCAPLVRPGDRVQTAANLIFGLPSLLRGENGGGPCTMLEAALEQRPTLALVALGFSDLTKAARAGELLGDGVLDGIVKAAQEAVESLRDAGAETILASVPSPLDTAAFPTCASAASVLKVSARFLERQYKLHPSDRLSVAGLVEIGNQIIARRLAPLEPRHFLRGEVAAGLCHQLGELNRELFAVAQRLGSLFFDLAKFCQSVATDGIDAGTRRLSNDYLGGFYALNGLYPGPTGHAAIANALIDSLNAGGAARLPRLDLAATAASDPVAAYRPATGPNWELEENAWRGGSSVEISRGLDGAGTYDDAQQEPKIDDVLPCPLTLPPTLEQEIPLTHEMSYHGDGMRIVDCADPSVARFGGSGELRFDGLALFGSNLDGSLKFRFSPPKNGLSHFTIEFKGAELRGADGVLTTPEFYRFPLLGAKVVQPLGMLAEGDVDLQTGLVDTNTLKLSCIYQNSGLAEIARLNPANFPDPAIITFSNESGNPRVYASAWAQFRQRTDGNLDFAFHGTAFVPLGPGAVFPLPFSSATGDFPTVQVSGTALHPHLHLSTFRPGARIPGAPLIPTNRTEEFQLCTSRSSFGDLFRLDNPALGEGLGRSFLVGRLRIQFGERFGDAVPFAVSFLPPAGLFEPPNYAPLQEIFPSQLSRGLLGHDGIVHYPASTYSMHDTLLLDDPLDIALGAVNINSGRVIGDFLHRGLIGQDLIFALFRVEPRTPKSSFQFRGEAMFTRGNDGQLRYSLDAAVYIPYPPGFLFPLPDLRTGVPIGPDSSLDPYLQLEATAIGETPPTTIVGREDHATAATGGVFSCRYRISSHPGRGEVPEFEFVLHGDGDATFALKILIAATFYNSRSEDRSRHAVGFSGYGTWSKTPGTLQVATVEISRAPGFHYLSIQINGGREVSIDTRPEIIRPPIEPTHPAAQPPAATNPLPTPKPMAPHPSSDEIAAFERLQRAVDQAALISVYVGDAHDDPIDPARPPPITAIAGSSSMHALELELDLPDGKGRVRSGNRLGQELGRFRYDLPMVPIDASVKSTFHRETLIDPGITQQFSLHGTQFTFPGGDGFQCIGFGRTFPMTGNRYGLLVGAIGDIAQGTGRFCGMEGNVTLCGEITARGELRGHIIIRVLDPSGVFVRDEIAKPSSDGRELKGDLTFLAWVGQKDPGDALENHFSLDSKGNFRGLNIATNLKRASVSSMVRGGRLQVSPLRVAEKIGQEIGFGRPSDPTAPPRGTPERPFPFEGVARYTLFDAPGAGAQDCGTITTNVLVGGRVDVNFRGAPEEPGLRFGFFGPILYGDGCFKQAEGMFYGASGSIFKPPPEQHVVTHFYSAVLIDSERRFR